MSYPDPVMSKSRWKWIQSLKCCDGQFMDTDDAKMVPGNGVE